MAAGVSLLVAASGCGDDSDGTDTGNTAGASTTSTAEIASSTTTATTSAPGTTVTPTSLEQALAAWVAGSGSAYLGACPQDFDEAFPLDGLCSVELEANDGRSVQGVGPPFSEIVAYVLLEEDLAGWAVLDDYAPTDPFDLGDAPVWVPQG